MGGPRSYAEALAYLYSFTDYEKETAYEYAPERFDLGRVEHLLAALGDPHRRFRSVHIAGTKGKGSVAAMSEQILRQAGHRTGLYTSPHLHTFRERMRVNGEFIPERAVVRGTQLLEPHVSSVPGLTTFELITALAFWHFAESSVDVAVVEVGLGGRLDATNVITPLVSVITSISYDHTAILGTTLSAIAREKAGIVKPHVPVVSAPQPEEALAVIEQICEERSSPLSLVGRDWQWTLKGATREGQSFTAHHAATGCDHTAASSCPDADGEYWVPLLGRHQLVNATVALATADTLRRQGLDIPLSAVQMGLREVVWPGRLEILGRRPWVVIDGAHNRASARELRRALQELFPYRHLYLIFATYRDKDISGILEELLPLAHHVIATQFESPRAASADQLLAQIQLIGGDASRADNAEMALADARKRAGPEDLICVTGSVRFTGEAGVAWARAQGLPLPPSDPPLPPSPSPAMGHQ